MTNSNNHDKRQPQHDDTAALSYQAISKRACKHVQCIKCSATIAVQPCFVWVCCNGAGIVNDCVLELALLKASISCRAVQAHRLSFKARTGHIPGNVIIVYQPALRFQHAPISLSDCSGTSFACSFSSCSSTSLPRARSFRRLSSAMIEGCINSVPALSVEAACIHPALPCEAAALSGAVSGNVGADAVPTANMISN